MDILGGVWRGLGPVCDYGSVHNHPPAVWISSVQDNLQAAWTMGSDCKLGSSCDLVSLTFKMLQEML